MVEITVEDIVECLEDFLKDLEEAGLSDPFHVYVNDRSVVVSLDKKEEESK